MPPIVAISRMRGHQIAGLAQHAFSELGVPASGHDGLAMLASLLQGGAQANQLGGGDGIGRGRGHATTGARALRSGQLTSIQPREVVLDRLKTEGCPKLSSSDRLYELCQGADPPWSTPRDAAS